MAHFNTFSAGGAGAPAFPNRSAYEALGWGTDGQATQLTSGGSANSLGSWVTIGSPVAEVSGFFIAPSAPNSTASRFLLDLTLDNEVTVHLNQVYHQLPTSTGGASRGIFVPMAIAAGATVKGRIRAAGASSTLRVGLICRPRDAAADPTLFSNFHQIHGPDTANSRASTVNVLSASPGSFVELVTATAAEYKAFAAAVSDNGTVATGGVARCVIGVDPAGGTSYQEWASFPFRPSTTAPLCAGALSPTFEKTIPAGSRLAARIDGGGGDSYRVQIFGWN